jgi:23S rRNA (adenine-C8)-methyltransferase
MKPKLYGDRINQIVNFLSDSGEAPRVAKQILQAIYKRGVLRFNDMSEINSAVRSKLVERFGDTVSTLTINTTKQGDSANKALLNCAIDGAKIEAVSLQFKNHQSLCISSQVGCAFGCAFCATGKVGFKRQLSSSEIADQVLLLKTSSVSVSFMGMGEPLGNPKVFDAISALTNPIQLGISSSRVNISTIGIVPSIAILNERHPRVNLTYSLHSPFPEQRIELMPIERIYPFKSVFEQLDNRIKLTNNRVWIAYLLLEGINDSVDHARALVEYIRQRPVEIRYLYHINLLPYNEARSVPNQMKRVSNISEFKKVLDKASISNSYRNSFGRGIDAACGQLFAEYEVANMKIRS